VTGSIALRDLKVDNDLLGRWQAPPDRVQWWRERVARCHAHLAAASARTA